MKQTTYTFFTAPSGVPSINDEHDAENSTQACLPALEPLLDRHDAFLVCCYSAHPLIPALRELIAARRRRKQQHHMKHSSSNEHQDADKEGTRPPQQPVTGIFEASVATCLQLLSFDNSTTRDGKDQQHHQKSKKFAIVTTGPQYEALLNAAVQALLVGDGGDNHGVKNKYQHQQSSKRSDRFVGTFTTGLNANELHSAPQAEVHRRMKKAAAEALERGARALCLGCAGMVGLESTVRKACVEALGEEDGWNVWIVDGVVSGVAFLEGLLRADM